VSKFVSGADKTLTNAYYEIEIDPETLLPARIKITALTGRRGQTRAEGKKIVGGEHAAFIFEYTLSEFGKVEKPEVPAEAAKVLARLK
jgi:hypothetical protein